MPKTMLLRSVGQILRLAIVVGMVDRWWLEMKVAGAIPNPRHLPHLVCPNPKSR